MKSDCVNVTGIEFSYFESNNLSNHKVGPILLSVLDFPPFQTKCVVGSGVDKNPRVAEIKIKLRKFKNFSEAFRY
jgi:hypothetical protein